MAVAETSSLNPILTVDCGTAGDYLQLLKPRVMSLVIFTAWAGLMLAPGSINPVLGCVAIFCIAMGAGAAGALNMWYEGDIDALMTRTAKRPIPSGRILPASAFCFGVVLACGSVFIMALVVNYMAAALLAVSICFYVFVYTIWLKRRTPQNIVIGGAAGALPPTVGWAAVTGDVTLASLSLFLIIFMWTPPHFWALSLCTMKDYEKAKIPMLPLVVGQKATCWHIFFYSLALLPCTLLPYFFGFAGKVYLGGSIFAGAIFLFLTGLLIAKPSEKVAITTFWASIFYLFFLFFLMILDKI